MTERDISSVLEEGLGIDLGSPVLIEEAPFTYSIKDEIWDNWFPFAYIAFQRLNQEKVKSFATIGTGSGADAVGALHTFVNLDTLVLTDVDERVVPIARGNVERYARDVNVVALTGSLCQPLREHGVKVDVIYENLPNVQDAEEIINGYRRASRYVAGSFDVNDEQARAYLLESHLASLIEAKESLNLNGSVICSIGGRVPYDRLISLVESTGYRFQELVAGFKVQTEPEEVLPGYAEAERGDVAFDFYKYDDAVEFLRSRGMKKPFIDLQGNELKELLTPFRISAKEALELYQQDKSYKIGHTVHMIRATKNQ